MRLDMRLPSQSTRQLQVPTLKGSSAYHLFQVSKTYQGVGDGARQAAEPTQRAGTPQQAPLRPLQEAAAGQQPPQGGQQGRHLPDLRHVLHGAARVQRAGQQGGVGVPFSRRGPQRLPLLVRSKASSAKRQDAQIELLPVSGAVEETRTCQSHKLASTRHRPTG